MKEKRYVQIFSDGAGNYPVHTGTSDRLAQVVADAKERGVTLKKEGGPAQLPGPGQDVKVVGSHMDRARGMAHEFRRRSGK